MLRLLPLLLTTLALLAGCRLFWVDEIPCELPEHCPDPARFACIDGRCAERQSLAEDAGLPPDLDTDAGPVDPGPDLPPDAGLPPAEDAGVAADAGPNIDAGPDDDLVDGGPLVDAGADAGPAELCDAWAAPAFTRRANLELRVIGAQDIPAGYLLKLTLAGLGLPTAPGANDAPRLFWCNGNVLAEVPVELEAESLADDTWMFRAVQPIPLAEPDANYVLYYDPDDDAPAAPPPPPRARFFEVRAPDPTSDDFDRILDLPQLNAQERWLIAATWTVTGSIPTVRLTHSGGTTNFGRLGVERSDRNQPSSGGLFALAGPAPGAARLELTGNGTLSEVVFFAALLPAGGTQRSAVFNSTSPATVSFGDLGLGPGASFAFGRMDWDNDVLPLNDSRMDLVYSTSNIGVARADYVPGDVSINQPLLWAGAVPNAAGLFQFDTLQSAHDAAVDVFFTPTTAAFDVQASPLGGALSFTSEPLLLAEQLPLSDEPARDELRFLYATLGRSDSTVTSQAELRVDDLVVRREVAVTSDVCVTPADRSVAWAAPRRGADASTLAAFWGQTVGATGSARFRTPSLMSLRYFEVQTAFTTIELRD